MKTAYAKLASLSFILLAALLLFSLFAVLLLLGQLKSPREERKNP